MLETSELYASYGRIPVLHGISLTASPDRYLGIIGRNGVGKTTLLRSLIGLMPLTRGEVRLKGMLISDSQTHEIARMGVAYVPENRGVFPSLTVLESLTLAARKPLRSGEEWTLERVFEVFPRLAERRTNRGDQLSGGEQQMLAIGRALMSRPKVLLLDEPSMGLAPQMIANIFRIITQINKQGVTILLVEQNAQQALTHAHRAYVLETGLVTKEANAKDLLNDPYVKAAYLGTGA